MPRRTIGFLKRVRFKDSATPAMRLATALASVEVIALDPAITFLVGANGSGKSTLLEAIAVAAGMNAEGGGRNFRFDTSETHSALHEHITLERLGVPATDYFLRAESFYNLATALDGLGPDAYDAYGGRSLHRQSHGESFLSLAVNRFGPDGLYVLDEPEAALSPQGQLTLLRRIHELIDDGCQFLIATHSPLLVAYPDALILTLDDNGIHETIYDEVEQVQMYRAFLDDPERFLHHLLG